MDTVNSEYVYSAANGAKIRVSNLHYDLTEDDLTVWFPSPSKNLRWMR